MQAYSKKAKLRRAIGTEQGTPLTNEDNDGLGSDAFGKLEAALHYPAGSKLRER